MFTVSPRNGMKLEEIDSKWWLRRRRRLCSVMGSNVLEDMRFDAWTDPLLRELYVVWVEAGLCSLGFTWIFKRWNKRTIDRRGVFACGLRRSVIGDVRIVCREGCGMGEAVRGSGIAREDERQRRDV